MSQPPAFPPTYPPPPPYGAPQYGGPVPPFQAPPNYLIWAILSTLFCCLPFGVVSIVFSAQVDGKFARGDYAGAQASSANAKKWAIASACCGVGLFVVFFLLGAVGHQTSTIQ